MPDKKKALDRWNEAAGLHARALKLLDEARAEVCASWEMAEGLVPLSTVIENHHGRFVYVSIAPGWMPLPDAPLKRPIVIGRELKLDRKGVATLGERRHVYDWRVVGVVGEFTAEWPPHG